MKIPIVLSKSIEVKRIIWAAFSWFKFFSDIILMMVRLPQKLVDSIKSTHMELAIFDSISSQSCTNFDMKAMQSVLVVFWVSVKGAHKFEMKILINTFHSAYLSSTGETIEESFFAATPEAPITSPVKLSGFHFGQFRMKPDFKMEVYFPSKDAIRPAFSCEFYVKGEIPLFTYRTFIYCQSNHPNKSSIPYCCCIFLSQKRMRWEPKDRLKPLGIKLMLNGLLNRRKWRLI